MVYGIRHVTSTHGMIKTVVAPPRMCEWTREVDEAQLFEVEREAQAAADYITAEAFNVEVFVVE